MQIHPVFANRRSQLARFKLLERAVNRSATRRRLAEIKERYKREETELHSLGIAMPSHENTLSTYNLELVRNDLLGINHFLGEARLCSHLKTTEPVLYNISAYALKQDDIWNATYTDLIALADMFADIGILLESRRSPLIIMPTFVARYLSGMRITLRANGEIDTDAQLLDSQKALRQIILYIQELALLGNVSASEFLHHMTENGVLPRIA